MKTLRNRFNPEDLNRAWCFWKKCLWCEKSGFDAFHHIISPVSKSYKSGNFNQSILNSCPIHNFKCHLYNPELHKEENEKKLLQKVLRILIEEDYQFTEKDKQFYKNYEFLYKSK